MISWFFRKRCVWKADNSGQNAVRLVLFFLQNDWIHSRKKKIQCFFNLCRLLQTALWFTSCCYWKHKVGRFLHATNCYSEPTTWSGSAKRGCDAGIALQCFWLLQGQVNLESGYREHDKTYGGKSHVARLSWFTFGETLECPHFYLVVDSQQSLNSASKAAYSKSKINNNIMRLKK